MIEWLQNFGGYTSTGLTIEEKKELETLRGQVKKYRDLESGKNLIKEYEKKGDEESASNKSVSEDNDDDVDPELDNLIKNMPPERKKMSLIPRSGVSAEVYGLFNQKKEFKPKTVSKTLDQIQRIKSRIIHSFLFGNLEKADLDIVISAFEENKFNKNDIIIKQGEIGDSIYLVESGNLECYKVINNDPSTSKLVKTYQPGDTFGELALLYNTSRAATIKAVSDKVVLWKLDRETFNHIVKEAAQKKREKYANFLKKVEILSTIDNYELMQICDAVKSATFTKDNYIIKEGETGDIFYILEEGVCEATKTIEPGKPEEFLKNYHTGDYFGERALIKSEPRACNIIAKSDFVKVIGLDSNSFKRLLGPIEEILKRNIEKYKIFVKNS